MYIAYPDSSDFNAANAPVYPDPSEPGLDLANGDPYALSDEYEYGSGDYDSDDEDEEALPRSARHKFFQNEAECKLYLRLSLEFIKN